MTKRIIFATLLLASNGCFAQDREHHVQITNPNEQAKLMGQLGKPLGTMLTVQGTISDHSDKGYGDGLNLTVQSINDSPIQALITIPVAPYFGKFGQWPLPKFTKGATYRLRVYETGAFVGIPENAYHEVGIVLQTTAFYFQNKLVVLSGEKIKPIQESPPAFMGKMALLSGVAKNEGDTAFIYTSNGKLRLIGFRKWATTEIGKLAEVFGRIEKTAIKDVFDVRNGHPRLVKLEDQIGMHVKLRGKAMSLNGYWWFNYRGTDLYVEKMAELPNWTANNHFRAMEITGILEQAVLPRLDQIALKPNRDTKLYYVIRQPSWTPIEKLLVIEDPETEEE